MNNSIKNSRKSSSGKSASGGDHLKGCPSTSFTPACNFSDVNVCIKGSRSKLDDLEGSNCSRIHDDDIYVYENDVLNVEDFSDYDSDESEQELNIISTEIYREKENYENKKQKLQYKIIPLQRLKGQKATNLQVMLKDKYETARASVIEKMKTSSTDMHLLVKLIKIDNDNVANKLKLNEIVFRIESIMSLFNATWKSCEYHRNIRWGSHNDFEPQVKFNLNPKFDLSPTGPMVDSLTGLAEHVMNSGIDLNVRHESQSLDDATHRITQSLDNLYLNGITHKIDFSSIFSPIASVMPTLNGSSTLFIKVIVGGLSATWMHYRRGSRATVLDHIALLATIYSVIPTMTQSTLEVLASAFRGIVDWIKRTIDYCKKKIWVPQTEFNSESFLGAMWKLITNIFGKKDSAALKIDKDRLNRLDNVIKTGKTLNSITTFFKDAFIYLKHRWTAYVHGVSLDEIECIEAGYADISEWFNTIKELVEEGALVTSATDPTIAARVKSAYMKGLEYQRNLKHTKHKQIKDSLDKYMQTIVPMYRSTAALYGQDKRRTAPYVVYVFGGPGRGKSEFALKLAQDLMETAGVQWKDEYLYRRNVNDSYWSGYTGQPVVLLDDFDQMKDDAARARAYMELIDMKNNMPYPLVMADLTSKGNTRFVSKLIIITSNHDMGNDIPLHSPDAGRRRRDYVVKLEVDPRFMGEMAIDAQKVSQYNQHIANVLREAGNGDLADIYDSSSMNPDIWLLQPYTKGTKTNGGKPIGPVLPYEEFLETVSDRYQNHLRIEETSGTFEKVGVKERKMVRDLLNNSECVYEGQMACKRVTVTVDESLGVLFWTPSLVEHVDDLEFCDVNTTMERAFVNDETYRERVLRFLKDTRSDFVQCVDKFKKLFFEDGRVKPLNIAVGCIVTGLSIWGIWQSFSSSSDDSEDYDNTDRKRYSVKKYKSGFGPELKAKGKLKVGSSSNSAPDWRERYEHMGAHLPKDVRNQHALEQSAFMDWGNDEGDTKPSLYAKKCQDRTDAATKAMWKGQAVGTIRAETGLEIVRDVIKNCDYGTFSAEMDTDVNSTEMASKVVKSNVCSLTALDDDGLEMFGVHGLRLVGTLILTVHHFVLALQNEQIKKMKITLYGDISVIVDIADLKLSRSQENDLAIIILPTDAYMSNLPCDITNSFIRTEHLRLVPGNHICIAKNTNDPKTNESIREHYITNNYKIEKEVHEYIYGEQKYVINGSIVYQIPTVNGDCGLPVFVRQVRVPHKLIGIHVAGAKSAMRGMAKIITYEFLQEWLRLMNITEPQLSFRYPFLEEVEETPYSPVKSTDKVEIVGCVEKKFKQPLGGDSKIKESKLCGLLIPPQKFPAALRGKVVDGEFICPLRNGIIKSMKKPIIFPRNLVIDATNDLFAQLQSMSPECIDRCLLTNEQTIIGLGDTLNSVDRTTSMGFPYTKFPAYFGIGKTQIISDDGTGKALDTLWKIVEDRENDLKKGIITPFIMVDTLKDERRPIEKVEKCETRVFTVCPMEINLLIRKYFGAFISALACNYVNGPVSVGINPESDDWVRLLESATRYGMKYIAGDYSAFDKTLSLQVATTVVSRINEWYDDGIECANVRLGLIHGTMTGFHLAGNMVYRTHGCNPSGQALTTILNSLVNIVYMRMAYKEMRPSDCELLFEEAVGLKVFGDDNFAGVHESVFEWYNMITLHDWFGRYDIKYTSCSKIDNITEPAVPLEDLTYLKRHFYLYKGAMLAPLVIGVVEDMVNFINSCAVPDDELLYDICTSAVNLAMQRGEQYHRLIRDKVNTGLRKLGLPQVENDWKTFWDEAKDYVPVTLFTYTPQMRWRPQMEEAEAMVEERIEERQLPLVDFQDRGVIETNNSNPCGLQSLQAVPSADIVSFLNKPATMTTFEWTAGDSIGDVLYAGSFPQDLLSKKEYWDKVSNYAYLQCGMRIGIRLNGTRFNYGKLLIVWAPWAARLDQGPLDLFSASGYPFVIVEPTTNQTHELTIPFIWDKNYMELKTRAGAEQVVTTTATLLGMVGVYVYVLNPLNGGDGTAGDNVSVTIYANMENVVLSLPDGVDVFGRFSERPAPSEMPTRNNLTSAMRRIKFEPQIDMKVCTGMQPISVGCDAQKKDNTADSTRIIPSVGSMSCTQGVEALDNLSITKNPNVSIDYSLLGSFPSESSVQHIASTPGLVAITPWNSSDSAGDILVDIPVSPVFVHTELHDNGGINMPVRFDTPLSWLANAFNFWNGTLKYRIQITCSSFHSGRLEVLWSPFLTTVDINSDTCIRRIIDIQRETEVDFSIPWINALPMCKIFQDARQLSISNQSLNGTILVKVVNPLKYQTAPAPEVQINFWVMGGEDIQFMVPRIPLTVSTSEEGTEFPWSGSTWIDHTFYPQMLTREDMRLAKATPLVEGMMSITHGNSLMGEKIVDIKQLLQRFVSIGQVSIPHNNNAETPAISMSMFPAPKLHNLDSAIAKRPLEGDYLAYFSAIFRFCRGSRCVKVLPISTKNVALGANGDINLQPYYQSNENTAQALEREIYEFIPTKREEWSHLNATTDGSQGVAMVCNPVSNTIEVKIPYFSSRYTQCLLERALIGGRDALQAPKVLISYPFVGGVFVSDLYEDVDMPINIFTSCGEDFSIGFITGPPPVYTSTLY